MDPESPAWKTEKERIYEEWKTIKEANVQRLARLKKKDQIELSMEEKIEYLLRDYEELEDAEEAKSSKISESTSCRNGPARSKKQWKNTRKYRIVIKKSNKRIVC